MRDIFGECPQAPENPMKAAQQAMRPPLPKRFYTQAGVEARDGGFAPVLDGRPTRTPGRRPVVLPTQGAAELLAAEWAGQGETIDPALMPCVRIVNSALDGVADKFDEVVAEIVRYAGSDLVCYRAGEPAGLVALQAEYWDPVLDWVRETLGARLLMSQGVNFVEQPSAAIAAVDKAVRVTTDPVQLAALHVMTTLSGSALISMMVAAGALSAETAFIAAHVDEEWNMRTWGRDEQALARLDQRRGEFLAACRLIAAL